MMNELNNEETKIIDANFTDTNSNSSNSGTSNNTGYYNYSPKNTNDVKPKKRGLASFVVYGLICAIVGGTISGVSSIYLLPKTNFFKNTPLYQSVVSSTGNSGNTTFYKSSPLHSISTSSTSSSNGTALTVAEIAKKVGPAVVGVSVQTNSSEDPFSNDSETSEGMGSGVIFSKDGYILTNNHVISGASKIKVIFNNKKEASAKVVNYDAASDLAVIKITDNVTVPAVAEFGSSSALSAGDPVVAIGNPLGRELLGTVTTGVVSATNRQIDSNGTKGTFIQTDAAINPGNSGGPLINSLGQVIGINSEKLGGTNVEGLGFAIPIDQIKPKLQGLSKQLLLIGIGAIDLDSDTAKQNNLPVGVYIKEVQNFSPAEKAGIQPGDVILKFDNKKVTTVQEINDLKSKHNSGDTISVVISRDGDEKTLSLKLTE